MKRPTHCAGPYTHTHTYDESVFVCVLRPFGRAKHLLFYDFISHSTRHRQTGAADNGGGGERERGL